MREITLEELLEAGCHFGHQVTRSNPKARDFIFETRNNICIIDLAKTKETLGEAGQFVRELAEKGKSMIVVGTKSQARDIVNEALKKASENGSSENLFYVTSRWVGGFLTNLSEVKKNFKRLAELDSFLALDEEKARYTKKEIGLFQKEQRKLNDLYKGVKDVENMPDALFIIDTHLEDLAVRESRKTKVATVGIVDTNADPYLIDYPITANDDAVGSIRLIVNYIIDCWIEGEKDQKSKIPPEARLAKGGKDQKAEIKEEAVKESRKPAGDQKLKPRLTRSKTSPELKDK